MAKQNVLTKAITMQAKSRRAAGGSRQLPPDPFGKLYGEYGLVKPPYAFDRLMELKEANPIHSACIEAKADDIAGMGWQWTTEGEDKEGNKAKKEELDEILKQCNPEATFCEILRAMWEDYETIGWGALEVVTDGTGKMAEVYYLPAYTLRAHRDGVLYAQYRDGIIRWFKRYSDDNTYDMHDGQKKEGIPEEQQAGSIIVFKKAGGRSSFYGIPSYVSAIGAIIGSLAVRDFNIEWFTDRTIPDCLLIIEGADVDTATANTLQSFFSHETKGQHNKLAILPIPSEMEKVTARLEKLTPDLKDASFRLYRQDNALEICIAHRVPPYRIGWPVTGSLGGNASEDMNETYKNSVIKPSQEMIEHRLNNNLFTPFEVKGWKWELIQADAEDDAVDLDYAVKGVTNRLMSIDEGRKIMGYEPCKNGEGNKFFQPSSWVEVGKKEDPSPGENTPPGTGPVPVKKIDEAAIAKNDQYWSDWVGIHHTAEEKMQKIVADFFPNRRSE